MKKSISFNIGGYDFEGFLEDDYEHIVVSTPREQQLFEDNVSFNFNGKINHKIDFFISNCFVYEKALNLNITINHIYKLTMETLYIGSSNINKYAKNIKKCEFKISHQIPFLQSSQKIDLNKYGFSFKFDEYITLEFKENVSLDKLNKIIHNLQIFFQVLVLDKDIEIIEKYFYLEDETKVEEVQKYTKDNQINQQKISYLIKENNKFNIENSLNLWCEAKKNYGRIFDYLSSILEKTTFSYIEFKLCALAQWVEAYSTIKFGTKNMERKIKEKRIPKIKSAIEDSNLPDEIKNDLINYWSYDTKGHTFGEKLKQLLNKNNFFEDLFKSNEKLLTDIKDYRNYLTHISKENQIDEYQANNLYEILKNLIYLFIMEELEIQYDRQYEKFKNYANFYYNKYSNLLKKIKEEKICH